jgi:hypothetical protein
MFREAEDVAIHGKGERRGRPRRGLRHQVSTPRALGKTMIVRRISPHGKQWSSLRRNVVVLRLIRPSQSGMSGRGPSCMSQQNGQP